MSFYYVYLIATVVTLLLEFPKTISAIAVLAIFIFLIIGEDLQYEVIKFFKEVM